ncbi:acyl-CoA-like ligand-binding transcription factor [Kribbella sp. CA-293567]|uniref:acyl-CoA-like ligand-binding transcription factor n=1 Tax=Kribbella sp. CA-293567 TaxID=3002436 RepID=UPI0022DCEE09|nr:TetR family transcriptional regulator [Kribbella sp. CA-293567]WBQ08571.1 TetR family transcriptional regulator [Kribbella sp. CA-293567]
MRIEDDVAAPPGRRERKKQETRAALIAAALRLAVQKGPDEVTVEEISEAADVSVRTFFNYFPHKEHAILGRDPEETEHALRRVREAPAGLSPLTVMRLVMAKALDDLDGVDDRKSSIAQRIELIMRSPALLSQFVQLGAEDERLLAVALAERMGEPAASVRPALIVGTATLAVRTAVQQRKYGADRTLRDLVDDAFRQLADGIDPAYDPAGLLPAGPTTDTSSDQEGQA